jgi:DNA-binding MarR family transcriptional regulator
MSNRHTIIAAINRWHECTIADLMADLGIDRKNVQWTIGDCVKAELVERFLDDGKGCYRLTDKGRAWLINRPETDSADKLAAQRKQKPAKAAQPQFDVQVPAPKEYLVVKTVIGQFDDLQKAREWAASHATEDSPAVICEKLAVARVKREVIWS